MADGSGQDGVGSDATVLAHTIAGSTLAEPREDADPEDPDPEDPDPEDPDPEGIGPGDRIGRFEVQRLLGRGGMGAVYAARDHELHRNVAVKLLRTGRSGDSRDSSSQGQQRMLREAQAMAMVNHPNLVTIYDVGTHAGGIYLAMEYVEGSTLDAWLATEPGYEVVIDVFIRSGEALQAVHEAGLVHRDFKPGNVMVTADDDVRVLDLGIARLRQSRAEREAEDRGDVVPAPIPSALSLATTLAANQGLGEDETLEQRIADLDADDATVDAFHEELTQLGAMVGTPRYMSPEQVRGHRAGPAADQFAFALCLVEALTGAHAFAGRGALMLMVAIDHGDRRPWPDTPFPPRAVRDALDRALSPNPEDRFDSMVELLAEIRKHAGLRHKLGPLAQRWLDHGKAPEYLLPPGQRLEEARALLDGEHPLAGNERRFLEASIKRSRRQLLQRRALLGGVGSLAIAAAPTAWLLDRRGRRLDAAMQDALSAQLQRIEEALAPIFDGATSDLQLIYEQRMVWLELLRGLSSSRGTDLEDRSTPETATAVTRLNAYFRPVVENAGLMSSLMVARDNGFEYLAFEDPDAARLDPPYRFYNRVVLPGEPPARTFEMFWHEPSEPTDRWLDIGGLTTRGQRWEGYDPRVQPWYRGATASPETVAWTGPYPFFISKDPGVTASIAWTEESSGELHVLGVDFMLTDMSRVTTGARSSTFVALVVTATGGVVALPDDPRFPDLEAIRAFYREFFSAGLAAGDRGGPRLPHVEDLQLPSLETAHGSRDEAPIFPIEHRGERLWAGRRRVGPDQLGLELWVVQRPGTW